MTARATNRVETRVVVDALSARVGGGVTDLLNLLPALVAGFPELEFTVVVSRRYQQELVPHLPSEVVVDAWDLPPMPAWGRLRFLRSEFPRIVDRRRAGAVLCMGELIPRDPGCPIVALVRNPNFFASWGSFGSPGKGVRGIVRRNLTRPFIRRLVSRAAHLIFVSEASRQDAARLYSEIKPKSSVAYLGLDPFFSGRPVDRAHPPPAGRFILSVSGVAPHKNHETLIRSFARLTKDHEFEDLTLVIAGTLLLAGVHRKLVALARGLGIESRVVFTDRLPHSSLPAFYRSSLVHVLPSTLETFGHPYVEAMACGAPVVASDIPVAREICGNAAEYFPTTDDVALYLLLRSVLANEGRRREMIDRGLRRSQDFSWEHTASEVGLRLLKVAGQRR